MNRVISEISMAVGVCLLSCAFLTPSVADVGGPGDESAPVVCSGCNANKCSGNNGPCDGASQRCVVVQGQGGNGLCLSGCDCDDGVFAGNCSCNYF